MIGIPGTNTPKLSLDAIKQLIKDDGFAMSFQTLGQYRAALLKSIQEKTA